MNKITEFLSVFKNPVLYETGGNKEYISENIFELTGYYSEEIRLNRDLFPGLINPEDYIETNFKIKNWHKHNEPGVLTIEFRFQAANGTQLWIEDHLIGLQIDGVKYMRGIMSNISRQKEKETELLQLRTIWREKDFPNEKEREMVFLDIQRQLDNLTSLALQRKQVVKEFFKHLDENNIALDKIDVSNLS